MKLLYIIYNGKKTPKEQLHTILNNYLESNPIARKDGKTSEIELRFGGGKDYKPFSKIDYDNVAQALYNHGFERKIQMVSTAYVYFIGLWTITGLPNARIFVLNWSVWI